MRLTLRQLEIFAAVADTGSTTAAASHVALSQSATSGALNELEALLEAKLFDRIGKRLVLNDTGRAVLPRVRSLLESAQDIENQFGLGNGNKHAAGCPTHLRIGASTTIGNYFLPALVANYLRNPSVAGVESQVDVTIGNTSDIVAAVARLELDVGFIEGLCHDTEVRARPWREDEMVIVCAPSHPVVQGDPTALVMVETLRKQRWLIREPGSGTREMVENALLPHLHQWEQSMQLGSNEALKQAAAEGLGLTCLSMGAVQDLIVQKRLVVVKSALPRLFRRFYLIHHRQKKFSVSLERFISYSEETS